MRKKRRLVMARLIDNHPELASELVLVAHSECGRPNIEDSQPGLLGNTCGMIF